MILMMSMLTKISKLCKIRAVLNSFMNYLSKEMSNLISLKSVIQMESLQSLWSKTQERISLPEGRLIILVNMKMTTKVK